MTYQPIENYGVIGDLNTVALVGLNGSIDFFCFPEFDSPTIFGQLLDAKNGGSFLIEPIHDQVKLKQMYLPDTNILLTRFLMPDGVGEITDFMPIKGDEGGNNILIRRVTNVRGSITYRMLIKPRFDYSRSAHKTRGEKYRLIFESADGLTIQLTSTVPLEVNEGDGYAEFTLNAEEQADFVLELYDPQRAERTDIPTYVTAVLFETMRYWKHWIAKSNYKGHWMETVNRSALALKLMTSAKYGSIVAAPTFSLPEEIGGSKNWDYRFTWIRDAAFTVYAFIRLGYYKEAGNFMRWVQQRCADLGPDNHLQIMYGIDGTAKLTETFLDHWEGYRGSKPVRIGNAAYAQLQLDIQGELMDSVYLYDKYGESISYEFWQDLVIQVNWVCENYQQMGQGIWEVRGGGHHFLYSRLMCWVAVDRAIRLGRKRSLPYPPHWDKVRDHLYNSIHTDFWDEELQSFVQAQSLKRLDAATLMMPLVRFISPQDPRWLSTLDAIGKQLVSDSLVYRYIPDEPGMNKTVYDEGTFSICTFWYVECLSRAGQVEKARFYFEKMLGYANHLGLFSEELSVQGEHLGNFPQAFTHLSLISAAWNLNEKLKNSHGNDTSFMYGHPNGESEKRPVQPVGSRSYQ